jgi:hypothetical protein
MLKSTMLRSLLSSIFFFLLFTVNGLRFTVPAFAQTAWTGRCVDKANPDVATIQGLECLFTNVLSVIVTIAGLVFLVMFISGGFNYVLSNGDQKKAAGAASTLTSAIIGLVGVIASWLILRLIQKFTGISTLTIFHIPG